MNCNKNGGRCLHAKSAWTGVSACVAPAKRCCLLFLHRLTCMPCLLDDALALVGDVLPFKMFALSASATPCCHSCTREVTFVSITALLIHTRTAPEQHLLLFSSPAASNSVSRPLLQPSFPRLTLPSLPCSPPYPFPGQPRSPKKERGLGFPKESTSICCPLSVRCLIASGCKNMRRQVHLDLLPRHRHFASKHLKCDV